MGKVDYQGTLRITSSEIRRKLGFSLNSEIIGEAFRVAKDNIFKDFPHLKTDKIFISLIEGYGEKLKNEVTNESSWETPKYFDRNLCSSLKEVNQFYVVKKANISSLAFSYKQYVFNEHLSVHLTENPVVVSLSTSGSGSRIQNLLQNINNNIAQNYVLFITINNTVDSTLYLIERFFKETQRLCIVNFIPPGNVELKYGLQYRTLGHNLNLQEIWKLNIDHKNFLLILDDDVLFESEKDAVSSMIEYFELNKNIRLLGLNPIPYTKNFLKKIYAHYAPIYYEGLRLVFKAIIDNPNPITHVHGAGLMLRIKDHPEEIPMNVVFHDGWLSNFSSLILQKKLQRQDIPFWLSIIMNH